jgi:hypothetical protein
VLTTGVKTLTAILRLSVFEGGGSLMFGVATKPAGTRGPFPSDVELWGPDLQEYQFGSGDVLFGDPTSMGAHRDSHLVHGVPKDKDGQQAMAIVVRMSWDGDLADQPKVSSITQLEHQHTPAPRDPDFKVPDWFASGGKVGQLLRRLWHIVMWHGVRM